MTAICRTNRHKEESMSIRHFPVRGLMAAALASMAGATATLAPAPAAAFVCATCATEWTQIMNNLQLVIQYAKQVDQYKQQVDQYRTQVKQYEQMYIKGAAYRAAPGFRVNSNAEFPSRSIDEGVEGACGTGNRSNPVAVEQYRNCVVSVQTRNRRYNVMRELLQDVARNDADLAEASAERAALGPEDQGALQANTNKIAAINAKLQNDLQNARYTIDAYNAMLASINDDTIFRAKAALGNGNTLMEEAVQGLALKAALRAARSRDR